MRPSIKNLLREPLVHFLTLGALLFVVFAFVNDDVLESTLSTTIEVGEAEIEWLRGNWERHWQRPPTETELRGLVAEHIREEVLYREAMAMGLDSDDVIVRRRLVQKLNFLSEDLALQIEPTEDKLRGFFEDNREHFKETARLTFYHIYFSGETRTDPNADAERVLAQLVSGNSAVSRAPEFGDQFMLPYDYTARSPQEISHQLGRQFADSLFALQTLAEWQGPVESSYGQHLVRISDHEEERLPQLAEVIDRVRTDYDNERRERTNQAFYESLLARYDVSVDEDAIRSGVVSAISMEGGR